MLRSRVTLFRVAGIAIRIDASWLFLAVLVTWSLAGPLATVVLILLLFPLAALMTRYHWPIVGTAIVSYLATINLVLLIFNLIPAYPLDGGRVLRAVLWRWKGSVRRATRVASQVGSGFGLALIVL